MPSETTDRAYIQPLVSIIVPICNAAATVSRALDSMLNQTYKNIEIVIINDGSTDQTKEIIGRYAALHANIRCFHMPKSGVSISRNLGLSKVTGEYIAFCDADDSMHSDMIEKMMDSIIHDNTEVAVCRWRYVDTNGHELPWKTSCLKSGILSGKDIQKEFLTTLNIEGFCWNKIISRKLFANHNIRFDSRRLSYCDILANYRLLSLAGRISCIGEQLYDYYQSDTSCTKVPNMRKDQDYIEVMSEILEESDIYNARHLADIYAMTRIDKILFRMYKNQDLYDKKEYIDCFTNAYETFSNISLIRKISSELAHPLDNPLKAAIKSITVYQEYLRLKRHN